MSKPKNLPGTDMSTNASEVEREIEAAWAEYCEKIGHFANVRLPGFRAGYMAALQRSEDSRRLDWLAKMHVEVRLPLVYGSRELKPMFCHAPFQDDGGETPWDVRTEIDRAMTAPKSQ